MSCIECKGLIGVRVCSHYVALQKALGIGNATYGTANIDSLFSVKKLLNYEIIFKTYKIQTKWIIINQNLSKKS